jgi:hypothetical protein
LIFLCRAQAIADTVRGRAMAGSRWRWKKTKILVEAMIIGLTAGLLIILFTETGVDRQRNSLGGSVTCEDRAC